jgi:hypothetical protein
VANAYGASADGIACPRDCVTRTPRPSRAWAAVAPRQTIARAHHVELGHEPWPASADLPDRGLLVNPQLPSRLPAEMLHHVCDVDTAPVEARLLERRGEKPPGGADERAARQILFVAGLLAHQHDVRRGGPLAEHRLGRPPPEVARAASGCGITQLRDRLRGARVFSGPPSEGHRGVPGARQRFPMVSHAARRPAS